MRIIEQIKSSGRSKASQSGKIKAMRLFSLGFASVILIGTFLLMLPISVPKGNDSAGFLTALFTSVSCTCVTGLSLVDTATAWSRFGHTVMICMIQLGGIGFMTFAVLIAKLVKKMLSPKDRMLVAMSYNINNLADISSLLKSILIGTVSIELIGAALIFIRFRKLFSIGEAVFRSIFMSISAFCNAGFDLLGDVYASQTTEGYASSVSYFITDPLISLTLAALILIGGIGFAVWFDIKEKVFHRKNLSVYSKFVLIITLILLAGGTALITLLEWSNPDTIGNLSIGEKILASFFHSTTLRTAGFANFDNGKMNFGTQALSMLLMFIGGASGSTAGGVKVVTVGVIIYTVICNITGKQDTIIYKRMISPSTFTRAASVVFMQILLIILSSMAIFAIDGHIGGVDILYEVISAVSTVGLTTGITSLLSPISQIIIILLMYFGRVGILTVTYALVLNQHSENSSIKYPDADLLIG